MNRCENGRPEDSWAHDFTDYSPRLGGPALLYCHHCGQVRELALPLDPIGPPTVQSNTVTVTSKAMSFTGGES